MSLAANQSVAATKKEIKSPERKQFSFKDFNTSYLDTGEVASGKTIVLVHGFGASSEYWRALYPALSKDYRLIGLDLLGYGQSDKPKDQAMSIQLWSE
jgi:pimeloyl-ACP methyl ester carboxylesterase